MVPLQILLSNSADQQVVEVVAAELMRHSVHSVVVDPVLVATSGHSLADSSTAPAIRDRFILPNARFTLLLV
jgi:hydroxymethylpyrimidine/phosphomethylpyrimidine kinase